MNDIKAEREYLESPENIYLNEIISDNEKSDFLENVLNEYNKEVCIYSDTLGKILLDKNLDNYGGFADWCGKKVHFMVGEDIAEKMLPLIEEFFINNKEWDKKMREFSAKKLTELANDWLADEYDEDENIPEITENDFSERISLEGLNFYDDGDFEAFYSDDDMFWGHSVMVDGNTKTGLESADLCG